MPLVMPLAIFFFFALSFVAIFAYSVILRRHRRVYFALFTGAAAGLAVSALLMTATAPLRGPFLVRALVRVRWPLTGRPFLWRSPLQEPISINRLIFCE